MDVYYQKFMGNGTVASKFRLEPKQNPAKLQKVETLPTVSESEVPHLEKLTSAVPSDSNTYHDSNCVRCYKLKKKCSRTYPLCDYCLRSGALCEYVERRRKKHRLEEPSELPHGDDKPKSLSISSLMHKDVIEESFRNIDVTNGNVEPTFSRLSASSDINRAGNRRRQYSSLNSILVSLVQDLRSTAKLLDELLAVKAIEDLSLPSSFIHTFISNYEWKYPILPLGPLLDRFKNLSFQNETLLNVDIYLAMAIGSIIYDSNHNTQHYAAYFSDALIESFLDVVSYDFQAKEDPETTTVLILLCIYAINVSNTTLIWRILGFLNRYMIYIANFDEDSYCPLRQRSFWAIYNLDKELSLMLHKPSQFIPTQIIRTSANFSSVLCSGELNHMVSLMSAAVVLHKLQDRMLSFTLGVVEPCNTALTQYSSDLEAWRVNILLLIYTECAESLLLQNFIGLVNLDYYYLLIELEQLESTELFQFTLQFLSNSFSLLLSEQSEKKGVVGISMHTLFWYLKFFRVVDYKLAALRGVLSSDISRNDLNSRLNDYNSNVQLIISLINFLLNSGAGPKRFVEQLRTYLSNLTKINGLLMAFNPLKALEDNKSQILKRIETDLKKVTI